jgi:hypothetical protein
MGTAHGAEELGLCSHLGWAERTTPDRHPWRTTSRTVPYVPYTCPVRPVQLGQLGAQLLTNGLYLA